jgi:hypothetical protein
MRRIELYDDGIGHVELVESMGTDLTIVNSARVSFGVHKDELDERDRKLIKYLVEHRHTSTLEHCLMTFRFKVPLYVRKGSALCEKPASQASHLELQRDLKEVHRLKYRVL